MTSNRRRALVVTLLGALLSGWSFAEDARPQSSATSAEDWEIRTPDEEPAPGVEGMRAPEPEGPLSLEDALTLAMMYSPEMTEVAWEIRASEGRVAQEKKWANPELAVRFWKLGDDSTRADVDRTRVILSQDFELGRERGRRAELARIESDLAEWDYETKRIEVTTTVKRAFVEILGAQRIVESSRGHVQFGERLHETMRTLVEQQSATLLEVHQLERQLGLARIDLKRAEADLAVARFALAATWGSTYPKFTEVVGDLEPKGPLPGIESILKIAANSPAMASWEAEVARAQAEIGVAKSSSVPDLEIGVGFRRTEGFVSGTDYILDFQIPLPLADRKQGDVREAKARAAGAKSGREATRAATSRGIAEYFYRVVESELAFRTLHDTVLPASRKSFDAHRLSFANQLSTLDDLLDARRDVSRLEIDLIESLVDYQQALAELEEIVGESLID